MNSKERVLTAVGLGQPDRVPLDFSANAAEQLAVYPWPEPDWFDFTGLAERLDEWRDLAIMATGASVWQHPAFLRSLEKLLIDLLDAPELASYLMDRFTDFLSPTLTACSQPLRTELTSYASLTTWARSTGC